MNRQKILIVIFLLTGPMALYADQKPDSAKTSFEDAAVTIHQQLEQSLVELKELRERAAEEKIPLSRKLSDLEAELVKSRRNFQQASRLLDSRTLDLSNLRSEIKSRREEAAYLSNLLSEYIQNFESRLHIAEVHCYEDSLEKAKLAFENSNLSQQEVFAAQEELVSESLERLHDALAGTSFEGTAVDSSGLLKSGKFVVVGPVAIFSSDDGKSIGTVEQKLGSLEPAVIAFFNPEDADSADNVINTFSGYFPLDPTLGNAHKIESTEETLWEHIQKGGPVMVPILCMAGAVLFVALYKWLSLAFLRRPSRKQLNQLLDSVSKHDKKSAIEKAKTMRGPAGKMLKVGAEHLGEPRELIEEVMYEMVLATRLKIRRMLPFIAICASSAPLLGLLGTVTGIINTFKLITVFGSGDVKMLSAGISEALITTKFGLIVAIPSLLLYAFLSRKAKGVMDNMEKSAIVFVNQVGKSMVENTSKAKVKDH